MAEECERRFKKSGPLLKALNHGLQQLEQAGCSTWPQHLIAAIVSKNPKLSVGVAKAIIRNPDSVAAQYFFVVTGTLQQHLPNAVPPLANLRYHRFVTGYHGCDASVAAMTLAGKAPLKPSDNRYDWLGGGIYFWEHGPQRAYEWAVDQSKRLVSKITHPTVLGAQIDLGICLDLLDTANTRLLRKRFANFRRFLRENKLPMPQNRDPQGEGRRDKALRFRDCAVIDFTLSRLLENEGIKCQTVRGVFLEGGPAFPGSKIMLKSHIQIAVRDPQCITKMFQLDAEEFRGDV